MAIVGGLRARLVYDSVYNAINDGLETLGWFDTGRVNKISQFLSEPIEDTEEVALNTLALGENEMFDREAELGSNMSESEYGFFVDVYGESGPIGRALANDVRDLIMGRHGGRTGPVFTIWDYTLATPTSIGWLEVERINIFKETATTRPWQKHWYSVRFDIIDNYMPD